MTLIQLKLKGLLLGYIGLILIAKFIHNLNTYNQHHVGHFLKGVLLGYVGLILLPI